MARLANSLTKLRDQVNQAFPGRDKSSDGWIGDSAHAARKSDHNPNAKGVVQAIDLTNDPAHGFDAHKWAREVLAKNKDPRIKYLISNRQIWNAESGWRPYTGSNPHDKHVHISVQNGESLYDSDRDWVINPTESLRLVVLGKEVAGAFIKDGTSFVPVRALCEAAGLKVSFENGVIEVER